ncbi:MAG: hypothetical protein AAGC99_01815 [Pseudomonadota bacterium]
MRADAAGGDSAATSTGLGKAVAADFEESIFRYGKDQSGIGILTTPADTERSSETLPIAVIFNSGLLHRSEPYRLNVLIARRLAGLGVTTLRVDLAGKGDTPTREGVANRESVAIDWADISHELTRLFGERTFLLMGICSGADNAIKLAVSDEQVVGLVLMDPICPADSGYAKRKLALKLGNAGFWRRLPRRAVREFSSFLAFGKSAPEEKQDLRDAPRPDELVACMQAMVERDGNVLAVFSSTAESYYNVEGQMTSVLAIDGLDNICREVWWPHVTHIYPIQQHRNRLADQIEEWFREGVVRQ